MNTTELNFPGYPFWQQSAALLEDAGTQPSSLETERMPLVGGGDPLHVAISKFAQGYAAFWEAEADVDAYEAEHRRADGMSNGYFKIPAALRARHDAVGVKYEAAQEEVSQTATRLCGAVMMEALHMAGVTDPAQVFNICRRVLHG